MEQDVAQHSGLVGHRPNDRPESELFEGVVKKVRRFVAANHTPPTS